MKNALALATLATLASCVAAVCHAATPAQPVPENLLACSKVLDPGERVKCYDAQIEAMKQAAPSAPATATAVRPAPAAPQQSAATTPAVPRGPESAQRAPVPPLPAPTTPVPGADAVAAPSATASSGTTASPGTAGAASAASVAAAPAPAQRSPDAKFGSELLPPSSRPTPSVQERTLLSNITAMRLIRPKTYLISLANGQIWLQEGTQVTSFIRVGEDAHITKGTLGSYHLWTDGLGEKNWVQVTRVQ